MPNTYQTDIGDITKPNGLEKMFTAKQADDLAHAGIKTVGALTALGKDELKEWSAKLGLPEAGLQNRIDTLKSQLLRQQSEKPSGRFQG